jgi:hypothetical protein
MHEEPDVQRLVYSSSASVYGDAVEEPMTENHPYNNNNFYGASKIAGEHMARSLYHRFKDTSQRFDYVGLRYMNVYGPRQDYQGAYISVIMKILDRIDAGLPPIIYGDGSQAYDFVYVGDCAAANVAAMKADATDEFYNVGTGIRTSIKELSELVLEAAGSDLEVQYEPSGPTFVKNRVGCPVKAERDLGFKAKVELTDGIQAFDRVAFQPPGRSRPASPGGAESCRIVFSNQRINIATPCLGEEEWQAMREPIMSGWLTQGPKVREFEQAFAVRHGVKHALAATSCTTALHSGIGRLGYRTGRRGHCACLYLDRHGQRRAVLQRDAGLRGCRSTDL